MDTSSTPTRWTGSLTLQFLLPALATLVTAVAAVPWALETVEREEQAAIAERLLGESRVLADALEWSQGPPLDRQCRTLADRLGARVTVIAADGRVLGESSRPSVGLESHDDRPEVHAALLSGTAMRVRESGTVGTRLLYIAFRQDRGAERRVVRLAVPPARITESRNVLLWSLLAGLGLAAIAGGAVAIGVSRPMRRRIERLNGFVGEVVRGGPIPYVGPERRDALGALEGGLAAMASSVRSTIGELRVEHGRLEAILRGMVEGVIVTDLESRVALINARARELLGVDSLGEVSDRPLVELSRDPALAEVVRELAHGTDVVSRDVMTGGGGGRTLRINGALLRAAEGDAFGYVLVLHDVTELRRLEVVRRDFVANVSHELRTPLTAIKGFAETLLGPAGDDREMARRFLSIIDRHSERLGRLIDDLLTLSNLELGRTTLRLVTVPITSILEDVLQIFAERMAKGGVDVSTEVAADTPAVHGDGDRLRQVLINLVDNSLKFTPEGGRVRIEVGPAREPGRLGMLEIAIQDTGLGIPARDLPRLTERFFRVDKARSRELGGTGLGLAIVKHIVHLHGGAMTIASTEGHGTTVRVFLPAATGAPDAQSVRGT